MQPPAVDTWIQQQSQPTGPRQAHHCAADHTCAPAQSFPDAGSNCAVRRRRDTAPYSPTVPTVEFRIHPPPPLSGCCLRACQHCTAHLGRAPKPLFIYLSLPFTTFRVCLIEDYMLTAELDERHRDRHDGDL
jgi:hypothetical protein